MQLQTGVAQVVILAFSALLIIPNALQARAQGNSKKPSLSLKATPAVSFAPARVVVVAEVVVTAVVVVTADPPLEELVDL